MISTWVALDPVTRESGAVEFVAGSHLWDRWFQPRTFSGENEHAINPKFEPVPDIEANRDRYDIMSWDLEAGDIVAFHAMTLHGSPWEPDLRSASARLFGPIHRRRRHLRPLAGHDHPASQGGSGARRADRQRPLSGRPAACLTAAARR